MSGLPWCRATAPDPPPCDVELRVHGVSGTPPEDLLARKLVEQVAGNKIAGFYRPELAAERLDDRPSLLIQPRPGAPELESYNWGGLTSGSPARALWLVLLPFTLVNIAPRARPPHRRGTWSTRFIWYFSRVLALLLTMQFVLSAVGVGEDLIGWQCGGDDTRCARAAPTWLLSWAVGSGRRPIDTVLFLSALVPAAVLVALWVVSARTANRYEKTVAGTPGTPTDTGSGVESALASPDMWRNEWPVRRLRALHMQCGFATILWTVIAPTDARWIALFPAAIVAFALVALWDPGFAAQAARSTTWQRLSYARWFVLLAVAVWEFVGLCLRSHRLDPRYLTSADRGGRPTFALPFYAATVRFEFLAVLIVLVLLFVSVLVAAVRGERRESAGQHRGQRPALLGLATAAFAGLGTFFGAAFASGIYTYAATWLRTGSVKPGLGEVTKIYGAFVVPDAVRAASEAYAWAVGVFGVLLALGLFWLACTLPSPSVSRTIRRRDYGNDPWPTDDPNRARAQRKRWQQIKRAIFFGRLVDRTPLVVGALVVAGAVIVVVFAVKMFRLDDWDQLATTETTPALFTFHSFGSSYSMRGLGAYLSVLTLVGLVTLGSIAYRTPGTRRVVGILWDVASFWPRVAHPLAAPCYAERTVPDLVTRISAYRLADPRTVVVVAAHSQGSVISAAAITQLGTHDDDPARQAAHRALDGVGFLSFGCVLRRLYGRYFPVYFGPPRLDALQTLLTTDGRPAAMPRWRNLWRYTDYLGGQVTDGPPQAVPRESSPRIPLGPQPASPPDRPPVRGPQAWEWHSPDPPRFTHPAGDTTFPAAHRHSDFQTDASGYFQLAAADLVAQIRREMR